MRCRVRATEAVGVIAASVGMKVLGPSLQDFVAAALRVGLPLALAQHAHYVSVTQYQSMQSSCSVLGFWLVLWEDLALRLLRRCTWGRVVTLLQAFGLLLSVACSRY